MNGSSLPAPAVQMPVETAETLGAQPGRLPSQSHLQEGREEGVVTGRGVARCWTLPGLPHVLGGLQGTPATCGQSAEFLTFLGVVCLLRPELCHLLRSERQVVRQKCKVSMGIPLTWAERRRKSWDLGAAAGCRELVPKRQ